MINIISTEKIYDIVNKHPDAINIMAELGFKDILKPGMLATAGKIMTIEKGAKIKNISWDNIVKAFNEHGYSIIKEDQNE